MTVKWAPIPPDNYHTGVDWVKDLRIFWKINGKCELCGADLPGAVLDGGICDKCSKRLAEREKLIAESRNAYSNEKAFIENLPRTYLGVPFSCLGCYFRATGSHYAGRDSCMFILDTGIPRGCKLENCKLYTPINRH